MRRLITWNLVTLDGFFEGTEPWSIDWHEQVWGDDIERFGTEQIDSADLLLFGRKTYEGMAAHWTTAEGDTADRMNRIAKMVFSRTLDQAGWTNTRLEREAVPAVQRLKEEQGKDILVFGSGDLIHSLSSAGLVDEHRLCLVPLALGSGNPLWKSSQSRTKMQLLEMRPIGRGGVLLRYQPIDRQTRRMS